MISIALLELSL